MGHYAGGSSKLLIHGGLPTSSQTLRRTAGKSLSMQVYGPYGKLRISISPSTKYILWAVASEVGELIKVRIANGLDQNTTLTSILRRISIEAWMGLG